MNHRAVPDFWRCYHALPADVQATADKAFALLREDATHRSLQFKRVGKVWSARVGKHYRALAYQAQDGYVWFWIGSHAEYDHIVRHPY